MNGTPENTPTESGDPVSYILDSWIRRMAGLVADARVLRSRLRDAGAVEHGAIAREAAGALEDAAPATPEAARLLREYSRRDPVTERDLRAAPRARYWTTPRMISAIAAVIAAVGGILTAMLTRK